MNTRYLYIILGLLLMACAAKKPEKRSKFLKGFTAQYNTLYNAEDALNTELRNRTTGYHDNFYAPYIDLFTYQDLVNTSAAAPTGATTANENTMSPNRVGSPSLELAREDKINRNVPGMPSFDNSASPASSTATAGANSANGKGASALEIAEAKAIKTIDKYSVIRDGREQNKKIFDAYITLAQARIYMGKPLKALDALNQVFTRMPDDDRLPLARLYQALAYNKIGNHRKANEIYAAVQKEPKDKETERLLPLFYGESLLKAGEKEQAAAMLAEAYTIQKDRTMKARAAFLRGQVLNSLGKAEEARASFTDAFNNASNFEFEVKSQIEIAKTYNGKNDYEGGRKYIEDISKKGTYASRKNEFYYALGLMANKAGRPEEADAYFRKALAEKVSDPQIRGLSYYEIGRSFLQKSDYLSAGKYYDSAITAMNYEPTREELRKSASQIKEISKNYYLIKQNDSILALANMSDAARRAYFSQYIDKLKTKEAAEAKLKERAEREKDFASSDFSTNAAFGNSSNGFLDFTGGPRGFYFTNTATVARGQQDFRQVWGDRALADNWRYGAKMTGIAASNSNAATLTNQQNPRRFETDFYIEQVPTSSAKLEELRKSRDTAALGLGIMYNNYFSDRPLATKTLYDLVDRKPEDKVMLRALYEIFQMNYEKDPAAATRAKNILINDYPYSAYAEFARNPRSGVFLKSQPQVEQAYKTAFAYYQKKQYAESQRLIEQTLQSYPNDALAPKLYLLQAFITGKTAGKEIMILQLQQISLNFKDTIEGQKAAEILKNLTSDIQEAPIQPADAASKPPVPSTGKEQSPSEVKPAPDDKEEAERLRKLKGSGKDGRTNSTAFPPAQQGRDAKAVER